jgi:dethiobiotin synthetase
MLNMCSALFREEKVPIIGVIVNKVKPEKMEETGHYLQRKLDQMGYPLLGLLPYEQSILCPSWK